MKKVFSMVDKFFTGFGYSLVILISPGRVKNPRTEKFLGSVEEEYMKYPKKNEALNRVILFALGLVVFILLAIYFVVIIKSFFI